jgi:adenosylcobinamide-GDP ribazoletransferase
LGGVSARPDVPVDRSSFFARLSSDVGANLRFFSRLPIPPRADEGFDLSRIAWATPLAGALIGALGAGVLGLAETLRLPAWVGAALAIAALAAATGALHEDGLADVADGFGGGRSRAAKLEIMRDSRIGSFGAVALGLSLILRVGALAALAQSGFAFAASGLILAGAASRAAALAPLALLPAARLDGAGASAGRLELSSLVAAALTTAAIAFVAGLAATGFGRALAAAVLAGAAAWAMSALARRQIGGQTGDVAGATQQAAEIACLCGLLIGGHAA